MELRIILRTEQILKLPTTIRKKDEQNYKKQQLGTVKR